MQPPARCHARSYGSAFAAAGFTADFTAALLPGSRVRLVPVVRLQLIHLTCCYALLISPCVQAPAPTSAALAAVAPPPPPPVAPVTREDAGAVVSSAEERVRADEERARRLQALLDRRPAAPPAAAMHEELPDDPWAAAVYDPAGGKPLPLNYLQHCADGSLAFRHARCSSLLPPARHPCGCWSLYACVLLTPCASVLKVRRHTSPPPIPLPCSPLLPSQTCA